MVAIRDKALRSAVAIRIKWIAWIAIIGVVSYGLVSHRMLFARMLGCGAGNGKLAKVEFCLREGLNFAVNSVVWSPDGNYIATGSTYSMEIHVWDVHRRRIIERLKLPYPPPFFHQLAWSPDGGFLAACDGTGVLRIYNTRTWSLAHVFTEPHQLGGCNHPSFSSDSTRLAVIGARLTVYSVSDWRTLESVSLREGWAKGDQFNAIAFVPHTDTVLVAGGQYVRDLHNGEREPWDGRVWLFCVQGESPCRSIELYPPAGGRSGGGPVSNVAVSPDGRLIAAGTNTGTVGPDGTPVEPVHIVRLSDGATIGAPLDGLPPFAAADGLVYTADSRYIIAGHDQSDGYVHIVSARSYRVVDFLRVGGFVYAISVNQRANEFAVGASNQVVVYSLPE